LPSKTADISKNGLLRTTNDELVDARFSKIRFWGGAPPCSFTIKTTSKDDHREGHSDLAGLGGLVHPNLNTPCMFYNY